MSKPALTINKQPIPGWILGMLERECGGKYNAGKVLFKVRNKKDIVPYILWLKSRKLLNSTTSEMDYNKAEMERWIDKHVLKIAPEPKKKIQVVEIKQKSKPDKLSNILKDML